MEMAKLTTMVGVHHEICTLPKFSDRKMNAIHLEFYSFPEFVQMLQPMMQIVDAAAHVNPKESPSSSSSSSIPHSSSRGAITSSQQPGSGPPRSQGRVTSITPPQPTSPTAPPHSPGSYKSFSPPQQQAPPSNTHAPPMHRMSPSPQWTSHPSYQDRSRSPSGYSNRTPKEHVRHTRSYTEPCSCETSSHSSSGSDRYEDSKYDSDVVYSSRERKHHRTESARHERHHKDYRDGRSHRNCQSMKEEYRNEAYRNGQHDPHRDHDHRHCPVFWSQDGRGSHNGSSCHRPVSSRDAEFSQPISNNYRSDNSDESEGSYRGGHESGDYWRYSSRVKDIPDHQPKGHRSPRH